MAANLKLLADTIAFYASLRGTLYTWVWSRNTPQLITDLKLLHSRVKNRWEGPDYYAPSEILLNDNESFSLLSILVGYTGNDEHLDLTIQYIKGELAEYDFDYLVQLKRLGLFNEESFFRRKKVPLHAFKLLKLLKPYDMQHISDLIYNLGCFNDARQSNLYCELLITAMMFFLEKESTSPRKLTWAFKVAFHMVSQGYNYLYDTEKIKTVFQETILPLILSPTNDDWTKACIEHKNSPAMTLSYALLEPHFYLLLKHQIEVNQLLELLKNKKHPELIAQEIHLLLQLDENLLTIDNIKLLVNAVSPSAKALHELDKAKLPDKSYEKSLICCADWHNFKELLVLFNELGIYKEANIARTEAYLSTLLGTLKSCKSKGLLKTPEIAQSLLNIIIKMGECYFERLLKLTDHKINILAVEHYNGSLDSLISALDLFKKVTQPLFNILVRVKDPYVIATQLKALVNKHPTLLGAELTDLIEAFPQDASAIIAMVDTMHTMDIFDQESLAMVSKKLKERSTSEKLTAPLADSIFNKNGKVPSLPVQVNQDARTAYQYG